MPAKPRGAARRSQAATLVGIHIVLWTAVAALIVASGAVGPIQVPLPTVAKIVLGHLLVDLDWMSDGSITRLQDQTVWQFRLPRALLAGLAGAGLSLAGALLQTVVRNPLAEPYILGVSAGAGLGAVVMITLGSAAVAGASLSTAAFAGALLTTVAVYLLARFRGRLAQHRLILSGVAIGALLSAITSFLTLTTEAQNVFSVLFFLLGSVSAATMGQLVVPAVALAVAAGYALTRARALNALLAGDETAATLGVEVNRLRTWLMVLAALLTGAVVAVSGSIGFVGLVIPHVSRMLVGTDHRRMLPVTIVGGGVFLMLADLLARTAAAPTEIPIGIVTAVIGAPFFLWLMRYHRGEVAR